MAYEIATPLTYLVLQRIQFERALGQQRDDSTNRPLRVISGYNPRVFVADVEEGTDSANPTPLRRIDVPQHTTPTWHFRAKR